MGVLVTEILESSYKYKQADEFILAIESLKIVLQIDETLFSKLNPTIQILEAQLQELQDQKTRQVIHKIINENKSKNKLEKNKLIIGMTKDKVINYISMPDSIEFIDSSFESFEIWIYNEKNKKLFFKNEKLYDIQKIEDNK